MSKIWLVASYDFKKHAFKKSFVLILLSVPIVVCLFIGFTALMISFENNDAPLGYVDQTGLLSDPLPLPGSDDDERVEMIAYDNEDQAMAALENGDIQAYYLLADNYFEKREVELVYLEEPGENAREDFYDFMQINWAADQPPEIVQRVADGNNVVVRSPDGRREFPTSGPTVGQILPLVISIAFIALVLFSAGYMLEGVTEEKLNRTIEVVFTSLSPSKLISGKVLGVLGVNSLQLITWVLFGILAVFVARNVLNFEWFQNMQLQWDSIAMVAVAGVLSYLVATALMLAIGSTIVEAQEGQALGFIFYMLFMVPLIAVVVIGENPNGPIAVGMSLLPFTSLLTLSLRNLFISIPAWQLALSILVHLLCVIGTVWLATRAFRLGMLRYGQRLKFNEIIGRKKPTKVERGQA